jgi:hypothetical protein
MAEVRGGLDQAEMREVSWRFAKLVLIRFVSALTRLGPPKNVELPPPHPSVPG